MGEVGRITRRGATVERDWTKGSIIGNLWSLSWPMMISNTLNVLGPTIDMVWVGKLGAAAIAAVGVAGMAVQVVDSIRMGLNIGLRAMIARFVGAGDKEGANHVAQQGFIISAIYAMLIATIGIFFAEPIMVLLGVEADVVVMGAAYMRIQFVSSAFMSLRMQTEGVMQASGDAVTPMWITVIFRFFHLLFDPFLIFGWWIFPRMGVSGAAMSNVIAQGLGMSLGLWVLFTGRSRLRLSFKNFRLDANTIWRMVKIGVPGSVTGVERTFAQLVLVRIMAPFGTVAVAAHSLIQRVDNFISMPGMGLGMAGGVLAGQNLGARQPERAGKSCWIAVGLFTGLMFLCSVAIWLWAEGIVSVFNTEPTLVQVASTFLRIEIVAYLVFGLAMVLMQCLNGIGDTLPPLLVTLLTMWGVQLPLALLLPRVAGLGMYGIRWGMVIGMVMRGVAYAIYFRTGRWKLKKV